MKYWISMLDIYYFVLKNLPEDGTPVPGYTDDTPVPG